MTEGHVEGKVLLVVGDDDLGKLVVVQVGHGNAPGSHRLEFLPVLVSEPLLPSPIEVGMGQAIVVGVVVGKEDVVAAVPVQIGHGAGLGVAGGQFQPPVGLEALGAIEVGIGSGALAVGKYDVRAPVVVHIPQSHPVGLVGGQVGPASGVEPLGTAPVDVGVHVGIAVLSLVGQDDVRPAVLVQVADNDRGGAQGRDVGLVVTAVAVGRAPVDSGRRLVPSGGGPIFPETGRESENDVGEAILVEVLDGRVLGGPAGQRHLAGKGVKTPLGRVLARLELLDAAVIDV